MVASQLADRYKVIKALGGGGFSRTYLAVDTQSKNKQRCIVKQLKPDGTDIFTIKTSKRLFATEVKVLKRLGEHDQIPKLFANFEEDQEFYLVEQYIEGQNLSQEFKRGQRWNEIEVLAFLQDVLSTLAFIHGQQVIHRDLKPANLMRRQKDGKFVLIDFGSVKNQRRLSQTVVIGTDGYMPSEQSIGRPNLSSDIYALGVIAIQALTGLNPNKRQLPIDPKTGEIDWRRSTYVTPELGDVIDKMVRYDFRQRYKSGQEALEAVQEIELDAPTIARRQFMRVAVFWGLGLLGAGITLEALRLPSSQTLIKRLFGQDKSLVPETLVDNQSSRKA